MKLFFNFFLLPLFIFSSASHAADPGDACTVAQADAWVVSDSDPNIRIACDGTQWRILEKIDESGAATSRIKQVITFGNDTTACSSDLEGTLRYTGASPPWEYCDGSAWSPFESAGGSTGTILGTGLVAWWKMDEDSGTIIHDETGNHDGEFCTSGLGPPDCTPQWQPSGGRFGGALYFDGVKENASIDWSPEFVTVPKTVSLWFKAEQLASEAGGNLTLMVDINNGSAPYSNWLIRIGTDDKILARVHNTGGSAYSVYSDSAIVKDAWYHVVFVMQADKKMYLYVNNVLQADTKTFSGSPLAENKQVRFANGVWDGTGYNFMGLLDDVLLYSRPLGEAEISALYQGTEPVLAAYCQAPSLCPNVGDVCDDGNAGNNPDPVFAGFMVENAGTCWQIFAPQDDQSTSSQWKTSTGTNDIANDSVEDGRVNDGQVPDSSTFPAFKACKDLTDGGYTDWYLPARTELDLLWRNNTAIGGFTTNDYWSSTEYNTNNAWRQYFNFGGQYDGNQTYTLKTMDYAVRCVRRERAPFLSAQGCPVDPACPDVGDVCSGSGSGGGNPVFAGCICYHDAGSSDAGSCKALYVTQDNQSLSSQWKTSTGTNDIANDSTEDGRVNDAQVPNSTTFPAFKLCKDLSDGGYTDWYLPARTELDLLWRNRAAINAGASGNFTTSDYWSSTEYLSNDYAWDQGFFTGNQDILTKTSLNDVRCVRRD